MGSLNGNDVQEGDVELNKCIKRCFTTTSTLSRQRG